MIIVTILIQQTDDQPIHDMITSAMIILFHKYYWSHTKSSVCSCEFEMIHAHVGMKHRYRTWFDIYGMMYKTIFLMISFPSATYAWFHV